MPPADSQHPGIFICYRREDTGGHAGRLSDHLIAHFGDEQIFMDLDQIEPGEDFVQVIEEAVGACDILLALIGRNWLASHDETGRRLDNPNDFVRLELGAALARGVSVIPVLVQGAQMPRPPDLSEDIRPLTRRQAFELSDRRWRHDVDQLVERLERVLARRQEARSRAEQEEEERWREAEARRQAEEYERLRQATAEAEWRQLEVEEAERLKWEAEEAERVRREAEGLERLRVVVGTSVTVGKTPPAAVAKGAFIFAKAVARALWGRVTRLDDAILWLLLVIILTPIALSVWAVWYPPTADEQTTPNANNVQGGNGGTGGNTEQKADRPQPPPGMVYVPGGKFQMGSDAGDDYERPAHTVNVTPFFIDQYEVTNEEYAKFTRETGSRRPPTWKAGGYTREQARRPVTGVTWGDAVAYAKWAGKRLPFEEEWEFAARGTDGRRYPWGNEWRTGAANADGASEGSVDVGSYPEGKSPFGAFDMVGNVWEWTASVLTAYRIGPPLPNKPPGVLRVIRGGSYVEDRNEATTTYRRGYPISGVDYDKTGFRCAKDIPDSSGQN
jgi:formylglycine-generating enzyme required for sulfatase activity